jgi:hypothetical protein
LVLAALDEGGSATWSCTESCSLARKDVIAGRSWWRVSRAALVVGESEA